MRKHLICFMFLFLFAGHASAQTKSMTGTVVSVDPGTWRWQTIGVRVGSTVYTVYTFSAEYAHPKIVGKVDQVGRTIQFFYKRIEPGNEVFPTRIAVVKAPATITGASSCKLCGTWQYYDSSTKWYLKISDAGGGRFRFVRGSDGVGGIYWSDDDNIILRSANGTLSGSFTSINFWTTGGAERSYTIICKLQTNRRMSYSVTSRGFTERKVATRS